MAKTAALFGGQGSQYPGMGKELFDQYPQAREVYACAGEIFGFDVAGVSFGGSAEELSRTDIAQPALFTLQVAAFRVGVEVLGEPVAVAGHSLGEYAALHCAGACSLEDMMGILKARTAAMGRACRERKGAMWAVMGLSADEIARVCKETGGEVWPVNFNIATQTVIAGTEADCQKAAAALGELGAKTVRLEVEGAFHTPLMASAADELRAAAQKCKFSPTRLDFYSNLTGGKLRVEDYPDYLVRHMLSPVRFVEEIGAMSADGIGCCVEFGPKRAIALAKKNNRSLAAYHVEDASTLKKASEAMGIAQ